MKFYLNLLFTSVSLIFFTTFLQAQNSKSSDTDTKNNINVYVGIIEYNFNFERTVVEKEKSKSNLRIGFGHGQFLNAGEGKYINPSFVHLMGKNILKIEMNLGAKIMLNNSLTNPSFFESVVPDVFLGLRLEKRNGGLVIRGGLNYPTILNFGIGAKF
jgi:hypothetical protein